MNKKNKLIYFLTSTIFFIIFDMFFSGICQNSTLPQNKILSIINVQNTGAAFSILENSKIFLILFSIIAFSGITIYTVKKLQNITTFNIFCVSMLLAGIFCNTTERIVYGYVKDYFSINFINFPIFNVSDILINISVIGIIIIIVKQNYFKGINE